MKIATEHVVSREYVPFSLKDIRQESRCPDGNAHAGIHGKGGSME